MRPALAALGYDPAAQPHEEVIGCNSCESTRFRRFSTRDRWDFKVSVQQCLTCELIALNPRMTAAAYAEFYDRWYRPLVAALRQRPADYDPEKGTYGYAERLGNWLDPYAKLRGFDGSLLDIGGSTGIVADYLRKRFVVMEAWVLDPSRAELEKAAARGLGVIHGLVEQVVDLPSCDLTLLCQTLDHLLDPAGTLRRIRTVMPDHGRLFVDILAFPATKLTYVEPYTIFFKTDHPFYFTPATARELLKRTGFTVVAESPSDKRHHRFLCQPTPSSQR